MVSFLICLFVVGFGFFGFLEVDFFRWFLKLDSGFINAMYGFGELVFEAR
jgi:hypothetical protein